MITWPVRSDPTNEPLSKFRILTEICSLDQSAEVLICDANKQFQAPVTTCDIILNLSHRVLRMKQVAEGNLGESLFLFYPLSYEVSVSH